MDDIDNNYDCDPEILEKESKEHSADFSCSNCEQTDCFYWVLYNSGK